MSKEWDSATTEAAIETAGYVAANLRQLAGVGERDDNRDKRLREFALNLAPDALQSSMRVEAAVTHRVPAAHVARVRA